MNSPANNRNILLIDDNPGDIRLAEEVLKEQRIGIQLHVAQDGDEALAFLYRRGAFAEQPRPNLILLDLNLLKKNGLEFLAEIKANRELRRIPVVVLTTSQSEEDIMAAYDRHVNCFITKPISWEPFARVMQTIVDFWITTVKLPPE